MVLRAVSQKHTCWLGELGEPRPCVISQQGPRDHLFTRFTFPYRGERAHNLNSDPSLPLPVSFSGILITVPIGVIWEDKNDTETELSLWPNDKIVRSRLYNHSSCLLAYLYIYMTHTEWVSEYWNTTQWPVSPDSTFYTHLLFVCLQFCKRQKYSCMTWQKSVFLCYCRSHPKWI